MNQYTSAEIIPHKLISNPRVLSRLVARQLVPTCVHLSPTNKCNLHCTFCSCANVDRQQELPLKDIKTFYNKYRASILATSLSGGEPLMYPDFDALIEFLVQRRIDIGLTTNGLLLKTKDSNILNALTWTRISLSDTSLPHLKDFHTTIDNAPKCDWAFSLVCGTDLDTNYDILSAYLHEYGDKITHMRVVNDILNVDDRVYNLIEQVKFSELDTSKVIFQPRTHPTRGHKRCRLGALKPVVAATGKIYSCCGAQYAIKGKERQRCDELQIGHIADNTSLSNISFDGTVCDVCYYNHYNELLDLFFLAHTTHDNFI